MTEQESSKDIVYVDSDFEDLVPGFLDNRKSEIEAIRSCCESADFKEIMRLGHGMKGAGAGYGFPAITEIGANLEEAAKNGDTGAIEKELTRLNEYLSTVRVIYIDY